MMRSVPDKTLSSSETSIWDEQPRPDQQRTVTLTNQTENMFNFSHRLNKAKKSNQYSNIGEILVDGGCDTSLVGRGFVVESTTDRTVTVQGFDTSMKLDRLQVVTAVTAVDLEEGTFILEVNEAIHVPSNPTSLLSTFQMRENGGKVDDVSKRHGEVK